jgi:nicotinate-nucleotide adenylyltransferase
VSRRVGVLGGAFNPPHLGHLLLAQEAASTLDLDEVVLVPTGVAPHKVIAPEPGPDVRLEMTRLAIAGDERFRVSAVEVEREGPSFAYRTLELLKDEKPGSDLTFVMGADVAAGLEAWRRPERVLELAAIAIAERPGTDHAAVDATLERLGADRRAAPIEMPPVGISSSLVRARVGEGRPIRWMVPDPVAALITERGLYWAAAAEAPEVAAG